MTNLITDAKSPIQIILDATKAQDLSLLQQFKNEIIRLYQYQIFKPMLDLCVTMCLKYKLKFSIQNKQFFEFDEGNCQTTEGGAFNSLLNKFKSEKKYIITIKKISTDVIIHEVAHMIEKEGDFQDISIFTNEIIKDINGDRTNNVSLRNAIKHIMIDEVKLYSIAQKNAEYFARFFQLVAMSKEVMGKNMNYFYDLNNVYLYFSNTISYLSLNFYRTILAKIDSSIANQSSLYIKNIENINHEWTSAQKPIHDNLKPSWSKSLKSIKE